MRLLPDRHTELTHLDDEIGPEKSLEIRDGYWSQGRYWGREQALLNARGSRLEQAALYLTHWCIDTNLHVIDIAQRRFGELIREILSEKSISNESRRFFVQPLLHLIIYQHVWWVNANGLDTLLPLLTWSDIPDLKVLLKQIEQDDRMKALGPRLVQVIEFLAFRNPTKGLTMLPAPETRPSNATPYNQIQILGKGGDLHFSGESADHTLQVSATLGKDSRFHRDQFELKVATKWIPIAGVKIVFKTEKLTWAIEVPLQKWSSDSHADNAHVIFTTAHVGDLRFLLHSDYMVGIMPWDPANERNSPSSVYEFVDPKDPQNSVRRPRPGWMGTPSPTFEFNKNSPDGHLSVQLSEVEIESIGRIKASGAMGVISDRYMLQSHVTVTGIQGNLGVVRLEYLSLAGPRRFDLPLTRVDGDRAEGRFIEGNFKDMIDSMGGVFAIRARYIPAAPVHFIDPFVRISV